MQSKISKCSSSGRRRFLRLMSIDACLKCRKVFLSTTMLILEDVKRKQVCKWLFNKDVTSRHENIRARRTERTGGWFLETPELKNWLKETSSNTLICYGMRIYTL
jgi:hypothetical protein